MASGIETGKFGFWLSDHLQNLDEGDAYQIFYDHGDKQSDTSVVAIKGFYGRKVRNANRLADIDVLVADGQGNARILVEVEEHPSPPKKVIGDVFAVAMCNRIEVKQTGVSTTFNITPQTVLVMAGVANPRGAKMAQVFQVIYPRMRAFAAPQDGLRLDNVRFLFHENIKCTIEDLKDHVLKILDMDVPNQDRFSVSEGDADVACEKPDP